MEVEQQKMDELLALLTKPEMVKNEYGVYYKPIIDIESEIEALRDITSNCPMCMFSAIRQKGIPIYMTSFDLKSEMESFWSEYNISRIDIPSSQGNI